MQIWAESGKSALPIVTIHKSYISFLMSLYETNFVELRIW